MPYCFRYRLPDSDLQASIGRHGLLTPVLVTREERPVVIAGHKRLHAARALRMKEIPAVFVQKLPPRDVFHLSLVSNWKQVCSEMDRVLAIDLAVREFRFKDSEVLSTVMPLLGLPGDKALLEFFKKARQFPVSFKDLIEDGRWPIRSLMPFLKFSEWDQDYFARKTGAALRLTSSQLQQAGEWLLDIRRRTGKSLRKLCEEHGLFSGLNQKGMDPRIRADRFFSRVKTLRFPGYSKHLEIFDGKKREVLGGANEFRLEPIQGFEEPGFELHARLKNPQALERLIEKLSLKRAELNSLFEIAL
jgi:hypothetical protein